MVWWDGHNRGTDQGGLSAFVSRFTRGIHNRDGIKKTNQYTHTHTHIYVLKVIKTSLRRLEV